MSGNFNIQDREDAKDLLADFPRVIRERGEALYRSGAVLALTEVYPGTEYRATVQGSRRYLVAVSLDESIGWDTLCDCPYDFGPCKHGYAALKTLLHGAVTATATEATPQARPILPEPLLAAKFAEAKGRAANVQETKFFGRVTNLFNRLWRSGQTPSTYDLSLLGIRVAVDRPWGVLEIWPKFPPNDHEFWLWILLYARRHSVRLPDFCKFFDDFSPIEAQAEAWRREQEVAHWRSLFAKSARLDDAEIPVDGAMSELRLRFGSNAMNLEIRRAGSGEFKPVTQAMTHGLVDDVLDGVVVFDELSERIWNRLQGVYHSESSLRLNLNSPESVRTVHRLLNTPSIRERIFARKDAPLEWADEPLVWRLSEPAVGGDYQLQLVKSDGSPASPLHFAVKGSPGYYQIGDRMYSGPPLDPAAQKLTGPERLPREAVESVDGISFLRRIKAELPSALAGRVRVVQLKPVITAELNEAGDQCGFAIHAEDEAGTAVEIWRNTGWESATGSKKSPETAGDMIVVESRSRMTNPVRWLPEQCRVGWNSEMTMPVTRRFAEQFNEWLAGLPDDLAVLLKGELASLRDPAVRGSIALNAEEAGVDWFDLSVELNVEDSDLTPEEIKLLLDANGKLVRLEGKGWRRLDFALSAEDDEQLARLGLNPRELSGEPQRLHALQLAAPAARRFLPAEQSEELRRRAEEIKARVTPATPKGLTAELRPYQLDGYHFLAYLSTNRFGGILADDMGLGKTVQTLAWLLWLRAGAKKKAAPTLVVCPKSVMDNWDAESRRFAPDLRVTIWQPGELKDLSRRLNEADLHVINYNQLRIVGEELVDRDFLAVILDEGQNIKNPTSQTARAACALRAEHRLVLTGTPIENRLMDLWSLMAFAMPGVLGNRNRFGKLYNAKDDPFARLRLSSRVRPFVIRRTKSQVAADLPDRMEEDLYCEIEGEQKKLYDAELKRARQLLLGIKTKVELDKLRFNFLTSLLRLRQVCCHPRLYRKSSRAKSAKIEALLDTLEPIIDEGGKVLVFSQFVELLEILEETLAERDWPRWKLTGATENRGKLVDEFQSAEGPGVFLISLKAGGAGLNLTAASYVVLFDPWWNPAVENQAIDRTHRIGQTAKVIAYRLLVKNSIEEKIRALQRDKSALAEDVLGEEKFTGQLTLKDLHFLLED